MSKLRHHTCLHTNTLRSIAEDDCNILLKYNIDQADRLYANFDIAATEFEYAVAVHDRLVDTYNKAIFSKSYLEVGLSENAIWRVHRRCFDAAATLHNGVWEAHNK